MKNDLKRALERGTRPLGTWVSIGHEAVVEINAAVGFDFVLIDSEHTTIDLETIEDLTRAAAAAANPTDPIVRIPDNDKVTIKRVLDIGVTNIMIPMVDSVEEAESLVKAVQYPPEGDRGIAGSRATDYGLNFDEYVSSADEVIQTFAQIETREGLENAGAIAAVEGIDALFVGPADLSGSLDVFGQWDSRRLNDAIDRILDVGDAEDVPVGTLVLRPEEVDEYVTRGFDYLIVGKDATNLLDAGKNAIRHYERSLERVDEEVPGRTDE